MALTVFNYDLVQNGVNGPLRVIGLAREEGHRNCKAHGLGVLRAAGVPHAWLSGEGLQHRSTVDRP